MPIYRSRKEELIYRKHRAGQDKSVCQFCAIKKGDKQLIRETPHFKIIRNIFAYSIWDAQTVTDHLMIVPKKHTDSLADLTDEECNAFMKLVVVYEKQGYSFYARTPVSVIKTVAHQHTHLIKTEGLPKRLLFSLRKPLYIRFVR